MQILLTIVEKNVAKGAAMVKANTTSNKYSLHNRLTMCTTGASGTFLIPISIALLSTTNTDNPDIPIQTIPGAIVINMLRIMAGFYSMPEAREILIFKIILKKILRF